jgi:hypothetical protein
MAMLSKTQQRHANKRAERLAIREGEILALLLGDCRGKWGYFRSRDLDALSALEAKGLIEYQPLMFTRGGYPVYKARAITKAEKQA